MCHLKDSPEFGVAPDISVLSVSLRKLIILENSTSCHVNKDNLVNSNSRIFKIIFFWPNSRKWIYLMHNTYSLVTELIHSYSQPNIFIFHLSLFECRWKCNGIFSISVTENEFIIYFMNTLYEMVNIFDLFLTSVWEENILHRRPLNGPHLKECWTP